MIQKRIRIFQIGNVRKGGLSGVSIAVPQYINHLSSYCDVVFINLKKERLENIEKAYSYEGIEGLKHLFNVCFVPDLVVFNEIYYFEYIKIYKFLLSKGIPYIIIPHGSLSKNARKNKWLKKSIANFVFFNRFINNASGIQCLSNRELSDIEYKTYKFIGTNGVDTAKNRKISFNNSVVFSFIGRLDIYTKGLDLLIQAIHSKANLIRNRKARFCFYGPKEIECFQELNNLVKDSKVDDIVSVNDAVVGREKEDVLLKTDVFIQTSRSEGMPLGILEALNYGIPCLITTGTGLNEYLNQYKAGFVAETNAISIASAIERALNETDGFYQMSRNAKKLIEDNFLWDSVIRKVVREYNDILNNYKRREITNE